MRKTTRKKQPLSSIRLSAIIMGVFLGALAIWLLFHVITGIGKPTSRLLQPPYKAHGEVTYTSGEQASFEFDLNVLSEDDYEIVENYPDSGYSNTYVIKGSTMYTTGENGGWESSQLQGSGFEATRFTRVGEDIDKHSRRFTKIDDVSCSIGICSAWRARDEANTEIILHVSPDDKLIRVDYSDASGTTSRTDFDYSEVPVVRTISQ